MSENNMTEIEKQDAGLPYYYLDAGIGGRKQNAAVKCREFNELPADDVEAQVAYIKDWFGSTGGNILPQQGFSCDNGANIHVGEWFTFNYNVTLMDIMPITFGDYCLVGPGAVITTVNHPLSPRERRSFLAQGAPVTIGDDVWIGARAVVCPGVTIGSNVVVAAGAIVTHDVPDNCVVAGVPAKVIRELENDL